jgi:serine phosphatase RsbU (regulator of sigma subunit)
VTTAQRAVPRSRGPLVEPLGPPGGEPAGGYRILLVEDDAADALLVEELLADTELPHTLTWRPTMAAALAGATAAEPHCILLDLHLPDATGVPAVRTLHDAYPNTAVVVLTGLVEARAGTQAVAHGAQDYLVKGQVTADLLDRVIRYAIHRKQAERATAELRENRMQASENARLERGLLPQPLLHATDLNVTTRYLPGRERALLGGDFLDVVQTPDGTVHAVIGDVSGHGPDEAALGVSLRITWRALVLAGLRGTDLLTLLEQVLVAEQPRPDMFATCTTVTLHPDRRHGTLFLAGHHEPLLLADGVATELTAAHGIALGMAPGLGGHWHPTPFELPADAGLLLYTDGLTEGYDGPGQHRLGSEGLIDLISRAPRPTAPEPLLEHLVTAAHRLNAGRHADDLAILHLTWG